MEELEHLCDDCRFIEKCSLIRKVGKMMDDLEVQALDTYGADLETDYIIQGCGRFSPMGELLIIRSGGEDIE